MLIKKHIGCVQKKYFFKRMSWIHRSTSVDSWRFKSIQIFCFRIDWNYNFVGLLHHPFWLYLVSELLGITFLLVIKTTLFGLGSLTKVQYPNSHILRSVSFQMLVNKKMACCRYQISYGEFMHTFISLKKNPKRSSNALQIWGVHVQ